MARKKTHSVTSLPIWAQDLISRMQRDYDYLKSEVDNLNGDAESNTCVRYFPTHNQEFHLPDSCTVSFKAPGRYKNAYIEVKVSEGGICVRGLDQISITPMAANHVEIKLRQE